MFAVLLKNLSHAARGLSRDRAFAATALASFALCLGANVVIFSVVHAVLLAPLEYPHPGELVVMYDRYSKAGIERTESSVPAYFERRNGGVPAFAEVGAWRRSSYIVGDDGGSLRRVEAIRVTPSFCRVLGMMAARGRLFSDDEAVYGRHNVVVVSDEYWRTDLNGDPAAVGRTLTLGGTEVTIIGVLPPGFGFLSWAPPLWSPLPFLDFERLGSHKYDTTSLIARLNPGMTVDAAQAQVDALNERQIPDDRNSAWLTDAGYQTVVANLHDDHVAGARRPLSLLQAGAVVLLLIGAFNITNLLLIRASARAKEWAVRQVLGASRLRIAGQIATESLLLALVGGALGLGLGAVALRLMSVLGGDRLPLGRTVTLDATVAMTALTAAAITGLVLAIPVVTLIIRGDPGNGLNAESRSSTATRATHRWRQFLITAQVALAFALLTCAGLLGRNLQRLLAENPGFQPDNVLTASVFLRGEPYRSSDARVAFAERWLDALRTIPGVKSAGLGTSLPVSGSPGDLMSWEESTGQAHESQVSVEGQPPSADAANERHYISTVAGDYLVALGVPLREGRMLEVPDLRRPEHVCVVDEDFADRYWPRGGAVGNRVAMGTRDAGERAMRTIVGVVGSVKQTGLGDLGATGMVYGSMSQENAPLWLTAVVRTEQAPTSVAADMRRTLEQIDSTLMLEEPRTLRARINKSVKPQRSALLLAALFSAVALVLAAVGIYGALAFVVAQRQREIGVRLALGALPAQIRRLFLGLGVRVLLNGMIAGSIVAYWVGRSMHGLLFGVSAFDPPVFVIAAIVLGTAVFAASLIPSHRAAQVSPLDALRHE